MKYFSTNNTSNTATFREAVLKSLPNDSGLYFPESIPQLTEVFFEDIHEKTLTEVAFEVLFPFCSPDVPEEKLRAIINDTFVFDIPLVEVNQDIYCLELFHGPTMAFKDVGARFLARVLSFFQETENEETTILVATSGDTGGAVASGFYHQPGIKVVILYPKGKVTPLQEQQMTTMGGNILALEVEGNFDDCQALVKQAFLDQDLAEKVNLSSANSINIARWLPQSVYFYVPFMLLGWEEQMVFSVPSGNYGNLTSGVLARKMGLPMGRLIASSNANDVVPRYLRSGHFDPKETIQTISNAMDVGKPSNFTRLETLYHHDFAAITREITGFSLDDEGTRKAIKNSHHLNDYLMDPHSAIAYQALKENLKKGERGIFLGTAHYCKFMNVMHEVIDSTLEVPEPARSLFEKEKKAVKIENSYEALKELLAG